MKTLIHDDHLERADPRALMAENELLRLMALVGELSDRRDHLRNELSGVEQLLAQARARKSGLMHRVQDLGGQLPTWSLNELNQTQNQEMEVK
jgi:hypothetical protein